MRSSNSMQQMMPLYRSDAVERRRDRRARGHRVAARLVWTSRAGVVWADIEDLLLWYATAGAKDCLDNWVVLADEGPFEKH